VFYSLPCIVIDLGTASKVLAVNEKGDFLGGVISVGVEMAFRALSAGTAALPLISGGNVDHAIGTNTTDSMRSGVIIGMASMIDGFVERFTSEMGSVKSIVATGGYSPLVMPYCKREMIYDADLLLKGMLAIYKKNR
jgi:type III pantothenate kinase